MVCGEGVGGRGQSGCSHMPLTKGIARFPFVDWAELLKACHSISNENSPHEKSVK